MKITNVITSHCNFITAEDGTEYLRLGPDTWYQALGMSLESVIYYENELEEAYQEYVRTSGTRNG